MATGAADIPEPTIRPPAKSVSNSETQKGPLTSYEASLSTAALDLKIKPTAKRQTLQSQKEEEEEDKEKLVDLIPVGSITILYSKTESSMKQKINCMKPPLCLCEYYDSSTFRDKDHGR